MNIVIITLLIIAGLLFFIVEVFLVPGIGIAGIVSAVCLLYANYYAFTYLGLTEGIVTLLVSSIGGIAAIVWFMRSKTLDKLALKKDIDSKVINKAAKNVRVGDTGVTVTRLALIGNADFDGNIVEVSSADGFLNEKTPIIVDRIDESVIIVKKINTNQ